MRLLVVGGSGFLGGEVISQARRAGHRVSGTHFSARPGSFSPRSPDVAWHQLDVTHRERVLALVRELAPDAVINTAYRQADWATTADGAMHVAAASSVVGSRLVHVSSDAIFSGAADRYDEAAAPDPVHAYGAAKAAAELAVRGLDPSAVVARTSLIVGGGASPTERLVHELAAGTRAGTLFTDDVRCAVHVADLAAALLELAADPRAHGIRHLAGEDPVSRYDLGVLIARRDGLDPTALPGGSRRAAGVPGPVDVRLDSTRTQAGLSTRLRGARTFLA
ncbi:sugar nucleotide-binding protein [Kineosporia sp. J2-2]|uniref:Sugar nucleotide-binding protein n=1 Tax=Kineosporia corallincola TaxID=2835133 RepID=A0ABS5TSG8_9ACTN|nr:sugar nucleotide-binding protein [Kineosporia corallincola]MBT0773744.1 sugar nucleotide-binding protein [Kineosporia corallincola]